MPDTPAPDAGPLVTGSEIARLAGVTRAAVSNWRKRYDDFPTPVGGGIGSPLFAHAEVSAWLDKQRKGRHLSDEVRLWQALRGSHGDDMLGVLAEAARLLADPASGASASLPPEAVRLLGDAAEGGAAGETIEHLAERFTESIRRAGSDLVTSPRLVRAVRHAVGDLGADAVLFDPACGLGTLLLALSADQGSRRYGQEVDARSARFAQLRAELASHTGVEIASGDSLREDRWPDLRADVVVCDPPVTSGDWGREELLLDSRWEFGTPSRAEGELAWLQHAYAHTAPGGVVCMVMPASVAYRKAGRRIRAELVRRGVLTQVVALPPGSAAFHALPVHLWRLRRPKAPTDEAASVRMVDLTANKPDGPLEPRPDQMVDVPVIQLLDETVDLTPGRHVSSSPRDFAAEYERARQELTQLVGRLTELLPQLTEGGRSPVLGGPTVSVADLTRAGLVECGDSEPVSVSDQLDTDFLLGFLRGASHVRRSATSSGTFRFDARGARVPRMEIAEQRR
ncbi:N-6 DNA methylase, partial [Streptomyces durbertensis]